MKKFWVLLKKEIKELITIQLILPFLIVVIIFYFIGGFLSNETKKTITNHEPIALMDLDQSELSKNMVIYLQSQNYPINVYTISRSEQDFKNYLINNKIGSGIILPQNFQINVSNLLSPKIDTYTQLLGFSMLESKKTSTLPMVTGLINSYISDNLINQKLNTSDAIKLKNPFVATENIIVKNNSVPASIAQVMGFVTQQTMFIPIILFMVIVLAVQMVAVAVATEKENKTLETLLSTPVDRKIIVSAKMMAAGFVSLLMAIAYMFGFRNYINGVSGGALNSSGEGLNMVINQLGLNFSNTDYLLLGASLFVGILLALAIAMILGAFAEDAKSAQGVISPLMVLTIIPYFLTMFVNIDALQPAIKYIIYLNPFTHTFLAGQNLLLGQIQPVIFGIIYQFIIFIVFVYLAAKIFSSDYIMTMKLNFGKKK